MAHLDRRRRLLVAGSASVLVALGLLGSPAGAQEDPSGTYEGTLVDDQQRGTRHPMNNVPPTASIAGDLTRRGTPSRVLVCDPRALAPPPPSC